MSDRRVAARPTEIRLPGDPSAAGGAGGEAPPKKGKKKLVLILGVVVLALGAGAYFFLKPAGGAEAATPPPPQPGGIAQIDPVSVNLAGGHYLRVGFSMQLTAAAGEEVEQAKALDIAIALYSGRTMEEVNDPTRREELKDELATQLEEAYEGEVMGVYLTDFVTQ
jgi:flagellar FliL protein